MHMRQDVTVVFGVDEAVEILVPTGTPIGSHEEGRRWLDEAFQANGCEPLRASGKVLTADKLLAIAQAIGQRGFEQDEALRLAFASAAEAALARSAVRIDVDERSVSF
jgi:hypothetical protein